MDVLLEEGSTRAWPPGGAEPVSSVLETPPEADPVDVEMLAQRAVDSIDDHSQAIADGMKLAALNSEASIDTTGYVPNTKSIWRHPNANPIALMLLLLDKYGQEYLAWHPDVLKLTLDRDGVALSNSVWNKILAGRVLLASPSPWRQWEVFHWVCRALAGESPNFVYLEEPQIGHLVAGYAMMKLVDPARTTAWEIDKFIAAVFKNDGIAFIPQPLDFAQRELEETKIECQHCNALHRDDNDVTCVTCGKGPLVKVPYEFEAEKSQTQDLWNARHNKPLADAVSNLPDTAAGSAVYRLLVEWSYAATVKAQMIQQLRMIGGK